MIIFYAAVCCSYLRGEYLAMRSFRSTSPSLIDLQAIALHLRLS